MTDTMQKLHVCSSCGFMSMQGNAFEIVGREKLCRSCLERIASLFYYEVGFRKPRGCQYTRISVPRGTSSDATLEVFNLHLGLSAWERVRQVARLARSQELEDLNGGLSCLVGGDFNDWRSMLTPIFTDILDFECQ